MQCKIGEKHRLSAEVSAQMWLQFTTLKYILNSLIGTRVFITVLGPFNMWNYQENSFLRRLAVSVGAVNGMYLGAGVSGMGNRFAWMDGSPWDYENFYPGILSVYENSMIRFFKDSP